jgi:hypothetical protein
VSFLEEQLTLFQCGGEGGSVINGTTKLSIRKPLIEVVNDGELSREIEIINPDGFDRKNDIKDTEDNQNETLSCVLEILTGILSLGNSKRSQREETAIRGLLSPLQKIAFQEKSIELSEAANNAALLLLTRPGLGVSGCKAAAYSTRGQDNSNYKRLGFGNKIQDESKEAYSSLPSSSFAIYLLSIVDKFCSSTEPHMRAMGIYNITSAIRDPSQVRDCKLYMKLFFCL